jgi:hypothetical protein
VQSLLHIPSFERETAAYRQLKGSPHISAGGHVPWQPNKASDLRQTYGKKQGGPDFADLGIQLDPRVLQLPSHAGPAARRRGLSFVRGPLLFRLRHFHPPDAVAVPGLRVIYY